MSQFRKTVRLQGGLGNKLFQIAYADLLNDRFGKVVLESRSWTLLTRSERSAIGDFLDLDAIPVIRKPIAPKLRKVSWESSLPAEYPAKRDEERSNSFGGYFQIRANAERLLLRYSNPAKGQNGSGSEGVMHVRRGDYLKSINDDLGVLSDDYYLDIARTMESVHTWRIVCQDVNDAIPLARELNRLGKSVLLRKGSLEHDFRELVSASNLIIANSTLSLWAAYLNGNAGQVFAPMGFFKSIECDPNLFRESWVQHEPIWS
jgi:hypothetical protein